MSAFSFLEPLLHDLHLQLVAALALHAPLHLVRDENGLFGWLRTPRLVVSWQFNCILCGFFQIFLIGVVHHFPQY